MKVMIFHINVMQYKTVVMYISDEFVAATTLLVPLVSIYSLSAVEVFLTRQGNMSSSSLSRLDPDNTKSLWNDQQFVWFVVVGVFGITLGLVEAIR